MFSMNIKIDRRLAIMSFIRERVEAGGQAPTLAEIAAACGFASKSAVRKHVLALQAAGQLEAPSRKARSTRPRAKRTKATPLTDTLFEISPGDIQALNDTDLRELVSRLCKARLTAKGHPPEYVTWGGDQRAPDGGIDVRVEMPESAATDAGFSSRTIGIQVKGTRMPPSEIQAEMCPGGVLRSTIRDIIRVGGTYYIACSDSVTDDTYQARVAAMKSAAREESDADSATFDFYDATRLADWTNEHPGVVAWVRTRLGRALHGWRPWGQWARRREGRKQSFFDDTADRLIDPSDKRYTLVDGLRHIRALLRQGGTSVRIVGLSGVGKTRFAQALFEEEAASDALSPDLAIYANSAESPTPVPQTLVDELLANNRRAILVIDDCSSQLHSYLTARCKNAKGVSLLTIEYDIREDIPEETRVFRLERGSSDLIAKILEQQFPRISEVNVSTICSFADGNSRVAIALADTLDDRESLAGVSDDTLFQRLFWQRREVDPTLSRAAEVCALVYSFDGEDEEVELKVLASLADISIVALHRQIDTLVERGLAQTRGQWRAILPHAIANVLAQRALTPQLCSLIEKRFVEHPRLLKSFSRRLGYLHKSREAAAIVKRWYSEGGLLGDVAALSDSRIDILVNVAPVDPAATLQLIERFASGHNLGELFATQNWRRSRVARLLRAIAYDPDLFERCLKLLTQLASGEPTHNRSEKTASLITSMFAIRLSGTHASEQQRENWIREALHSTDIRLQGIAIDCLDAALEDHQFSPHDVFDFGARPRDYGYSPKGEKARAWFKHFVALAVEFALQPTEVGARARKILATRFRSLWGTVNLYDELEQATAQLAGTGWEEGWLAIKQTLRFDGKDMRADALARLKVLEGSVRPQTLVERTKAVVLHSFSGGLDITDSDDDTSAYERAEQQAENLGKNVVRDPDAFEELLPLIVENRQGRQWMFGVGLASGAIKPSETWASLVDAFQATPENRRNVQVLRGFLNGIFKRDCELFELFLDQASEHPVLASWLPILQLSEKVNVRGCQRLLRSMEDPNIPVEIYSYLGYGRVTSELEDKDVVDLLRRLSRLPNGVDVAIDVLSMHIHDEPKPASSALVALGRELIAHFSMGRRDHRLDFALKGLVDKCLQGEEGEPYARLLLRKLKKEMEAFTLSPYEMNDTLKALFSAQAVTALDELIGDKSGKSHIRRRAMRDEDLRHPLTEVPGAILIGWCAAGGPTRWRNVAEVLPLFASDPGEAKVRWSEDAIALLQAAPEPLTIAGVFVDRIEPSSWSGSRAEAIEARLPLLDALTAPLGLEGNSAIALWKSRLQESVERERRHEFDRHQAQNQRFE